MLILYTDVCLPCKYKAHIKLLRHIAANLRVELQIIEVKYRPEMAAEAAKRSSLPLPFVYNDVSGKSIELKNIMGGFNI